MRVSVAIQYIIRSIVLSFRGHHGELQDEGKSMSASFPGILDETLP
jgi:hypothetical protein